MADTRGVFGLRQVLLFKNKNEWVPLEDVWLESQFLGTGYFGGKPTLDKVDFTTDTLSNLPDLNPHPGAFGSTESSTAAYFGGGSVTTVDKVVYSTDTISALSGGLPAAHNQGTATGNNTAGYYAGGLGHTGQMAKVLYSNETISSVPGAGLVPGRYVAAATGNQTDGYFGGGWLPGNASSIDKLNYSTETRGLLPSSGNLSLARFWISAAGNGTSGYFGGGFPSYATVDKITYSSNTTVAVPGANLTVARNALGATSNNSAGYFAGGSGTTIIDKIDYSSDTTSRLASADLSTARGGFGASSSRANGLTAITGSVPVPVIV